jgi:hypothetical protein
MQSLCGEVRLKRSLDRAWQKVHHSALLSKSPLTVESAQQFQAQISTHIRRIQDQLREERFDFGVARTVIVKKASKGVRPLVVAVTAGSDLHFTGWAW